LEKSLEEKVEKPKIFKVGRKKSVKFADLEPIYKALEAQGKQIDALSKSVSQVVEALANLAKSGTEEVSSPKASGTIGQLIASKMISSLLGERESVFDRLVKRSFIEAYLFDREIRRGILRHLGRGFVKRFSKNVERLERMFPLEEVEEKEEEEIEG